MTNHLIASDLYGTESQQQAYAYSTLIIQCVLAYHSNSDCEDLVAKSKSLRSEPQAKFDESPKNLCLGCKFAGSRNALRLEFCFDRLQITRRFQMYGHIRSVRLQSRFAGTKLIIWTSQVGRILRYIQIRWSHWLCCFWKILTGESSFLQKSFDHAPLCEVLITVNW